MSDVAAFPIIFTLLAVLSASSALCFTFWSGESWPRSLCKTLAVGALCVWAYAVGHPVLALALGLSALGDLALSRPGDRAFLIGMLAFALGHLTYFGLFYSGGLVELGSRQSVLVVGVAAAALWLGPVFARKAGALAIPVLIYVAIIGLMGAGAVLQPSGAGQTITLAGALLFMMSDAFIGQERFLQHHWPVQSHAIWGFYYLGQVALFVGFIWIG